MPRFRLAPLASLLIAFLLSGCALMQPRLEQPNISLVDFKIQEVGLLQQRYTLVLNVQNPNREAIPVRGMSYALQIAGDEFAKGVAPKAFTLPAYGETQVEVDMSTNLISTLGKLQRLVEERRDVVNYQLSGKLDVDANFYSGTLPFTNKGELKLTF